MIIGGERMIIICKINNLTSLLRSGKALDLRSIGHGFNSHGAKLHNNPGQVVLTDVSLSPSSITWYWWRSSAGKMTTGLAESNGILQLGNDLISHLQADCLYTGISSKCSVTNTGELYLFSPKWTRSNCFIKYLIDCTTTSVQQLWSSGVLCCRSDCLEQPAYHIRDATLSPSSFKTEDTSFQVPWQVGWFVESLTTEKPK